MYYKFKHELWSNRKEASALNAKAIGKELLRLRGEKSQRAVALELGVSPSALYMY